MLSKQTISRCAPILVCTFFLSTSSCVKNKLWKNLSANKAVITDHQQKLRPNIYSSKGQNLSWNKAVDLALAQNLNYIQAQKGLEEAKKGRQKAFLRIAPRFFTYASVNRSIADIANISSDDINLSIASSVAIPNPISFYAELYSVALSELQTQWSLEIQRRQLIASVYRLYLQQEQLDRQISRLNTLKASIDKAELLSIANTFNTIETSTQQIESTREYLRLSANRIFNTPGAHWKLSGSIPTVSYANKLNSLDYRKGYANTGLKLQTIQLESIAAQIMSAKARRLPNLSLGLSTPQIYNSSTDQSFDFDGERFRLFSGLSKSLSISDPLDRENLANSKYRASISRQRLLQQLETELSQLHSNKRRYRILLAQKSTAKELQSAANRNQTSTDPERLLSSIKQQQSTLESLDSINRQLLQIDLEFWIWDDNYWKNH